jgi:hypothetical protein
MQRVIVIPTSYFIYLHILYNLHITFYPLLASFLLLRLLLFLPTTDEFTYLFIRLHATQWI